ncbi:MAG: lipopolysaccharide heptosyltransferase II [Pyrinomonadaceae bacterium]
MKSKVPITSIVVRGTNWIGDAIMTIPALRELSRIFPEAEIVLHTRQWAEGLFRDANFLDRIITFEKKRWKFEDISGQAHTLRGENFDLAILLPNSFESALTARLAGIARSIGYNKDLRGLLLTDPIPVPEWRNKRHEVFYFLNLIAEVEKRYLGTETVLGSDPDSALQISEERKAEARLALKTSGVDMTKKIVALGVGSTNSRAKRWGADSYARLNDRFLNELDANVILIGSADEIGVAAEVHGLSGSPPVNMTGKTDLAEAAAILSVIDLLVSNDMGLAHVAPAVGTRTAVIFGPTNPVTTRPFSENAVVIRHNVECSPCMLRDCPIDHRCMTRVSVEEVFNVCRDLLAPPPVE